MQPATDTVMITLCSQAFPLKASLRAAYHLNRKYTGFQNLANAIAQGSFTAYQDVIGECADAAALNTFLAPFRDPDALMTPLRKSILGIQPELLELVRILAGVRQSDDEPAQVGEPIKFEDFHMMLYRLGTGFLWWTPDATWEASPNEIMEAAKGRRQMLEAVFGGKKDEGDNLSLSSPDTRAQLNALGDLSVMSTKGPR